MVQKIFVTLHENSKQLPNRNVFSYLEGPEKAGRIKERQITASHAELCFAIHPCTQYLTEGYYLGYLQGAAGWSPLAAGGHSGM